jgi:hypothetical protein
MKILRIITAWFMIVGASTSAFAGDLQKSVANAAQQQAEIQDRPIPKACLWAGSALFIGGMAVGVYGFLNNRNGDFPQVDEANATNKRLGAAGLGLAFVGGTVLFLGSRHARQSPTLTFGPGRMKVTKQISW